MSLSRYQPTPRIRDAVAELRAKIAEAESRGVEKAGMLLRLTHGDASVLKRSRSVADEEISFDGGMTFLGVKVETGVVTVSELVSA